MAFTVSGELQGTVRTIAWDDGQLSGDPATVEYLRTIFDSLEGHRIRLPGGVSMTSKHLTHPLAALIIICQQYGRLDAVDGEIPELPGH